VELLGCRAGSVGFDALLKGTLRIGCLVCRPRGAGGKEKKEEVVSVI